jgi:hypothetical protein
MNESTLHWMLNKRRTSVNVAFGALFILVISLCLVATDTASAQDGSTVRIDPDSVRAQAGKAFTVSVAIDDVVDLGAYQFTLEFDEDHIEFVDAENGPFLGSTGRTVLPVGPVTGTGIVTFGAVSEPGAPGPSGTGVLAVVTLKALSEGDTFLRLDEVLLADTANEALEVFETNGSIVFISDSGGLDESLFLPYLLRAR